MFNNRRQEFKVMTISLMLLRPPLRDQWLAGALLLCQHGARPMRRGSSNALVNGICFFFFQTRLVRRDALYYNKRPTLSTNASGISTAKCNKCTISCAQLVIFLPRSPIYVIRGFQAHSHFPIPVQAFSLKTSCIFLFPSILTLFPFVNTAS